MNDDFMKPIIELFSTEMRTAVDNGIMKAVYDVGVNVDKERLLQALKDAKAFWHEGYAAGRRGEPDWISVEESMPDDWVSVLGHMTDAGEFPSVRECYAVDGNFWFPALREFHPVSHWAPMPTKEES